MKIAEYLRTMRERFGRRVYSQEGEDLILLRYLDSHRAGFFVDVGAHHPFRFSNTYLLYRRGWRGVNIDALPGSMRKFQRYRPRDINIEAAIGSSAESATYFMFNESALNTLDRDVAAQRQVPPYRLIGQETLPLRPLRDVLAEVVPAGQVIDLLTVDVEGRDLDVLRSNDWVRFRPKMVLAETPGRDLADLAGDPIPMLLGPLGYVIVAKTYNTTFMVDRSD